MGGRKVCDNQRGHDKMKIDIPAPLLVQVFSGDSLGTERVPFRHIYGTMRSEDCTRASRECWGGRDVGWERWWGGLGDDGRGAAHRTSPQGVARELGTSRYIALYVGTAQSQAGRLPTPAEVANRRQSV